MPFDLATAKPVTQGFDLSTARPVAGGSMADQIPGLSPAEKQANDARNAAGRAAGIVTAADNVANEPHPSEDSFLDMAHGVINEVPKTLARGLVAGVVAPLYGVGREILAGKLGDGSQYAQQEAGKAAEAVAYRPKTNTARYLLEKLGAAAQLVPPVMPELSALQSGAVSSGSAMRQLAGPSALAADAADAATVANGARGGLRELVGIAPKSTMAGGGAARTSEQTLRMERAASMNPPLPLTEGMVTREPAQIRFEKDTARQPGGERLNNRAVELNKKVFQNIDNMVEETGAQAPELRVTGKLIDKALVGKFNMKQSEVRKAYDDARTGGQMDDLVPYAPLTKYLADNEAEATVGNAPMLSYVKRKLELLDPDGTGKISINDAELLRQKAAAITNEGTPNASFIGPVKKLIDGMTEPETVGGPLYRQARRLNENFKNEFENVSMVDDLLRTKPGSKTRSVALEDVAQRVLIDGSADEMKHVFRLLTAFPKGAPAELVEQGAQAAKELRGALVNRLKKAAFENATRDTSGNAVANFGSFNRMVNALDEDGKLQFALGKDGAQRVRDVRDAMADVYTSPPGTVNASNNSAEIVAAINSLDKVVGALRAVPGASTAAKYVEQKIQTHRLNKKVDKALDPTGDR